jgi:two-component system nitrogen regulation sensor histidine kinase GlnL
MPRFALLALSALLAALAVFVYLARPRDRVKRWFALFTLFVASWALGIAELETGTHLDFWGRFTFASATLIPTAFFAFTYYYPTLSTWPARTFLTGVLSCGSIIAVLTLVTPLLVRHVTLTREGLSRTTGVLYPGFAVYFVLAWLIALATFIGKWRRARGLARAQLQYLGTGIMVSVAGGTTVNFILPLLTGRSTYSWLGPYFGLVLTLMVGHAIIRHRLMDLRLAIHRTLAYTTCIAVLSGVALAVSRVAFGSGWTLSINSDIVLVVMMILAMLSTPVHRLFMTFIDPYLYRRKVDYPFALKDATHRLSHLMEPRELSLQLCGIVMTTVLPDAFSLIARAHEGEDLEELATDCPLPMSGLISCDSPLLKLLASLPKPSVLIVNAPREAGRTREAHDLLRNAGVEIVMVLGRRGELLGAAFLGARKSGDAYFADDIGFLESLAELASISLENGLLYRQRIAMLDYSNRLLESLDSAVVAVDAAGRITSFNPAATSLLSLSADALGKPLELLPANVGWALALAVRGEWRPREVEAVVWNPVRGDLPVILSTAVLHAPTGIVSGALVVVTDLSTVKTLERNQRRVEHFATMARFYAGLAHEIRSPLTSISNFVAMLADRFDDPEYRDTAARLLPAEVARIVRLAERLRLMAPSENGTLTPISLHTLLFDIVAIHAPTAQEHDIQLALNSSPDTPPIMGDPGQLVQLFVNLINNATESMSGGGVVSIDTSLTRRSAASTIVVQIVDDGCGIDPTIRGKIFQPFFTTKPFGTGLGLAICQEIATFHRARLMVLPRVGARGTIALVEFPGAIEVTGPDSLDHRRPLHSSIQRGSED